MRNTFVIFLLLTGCLAPCRGGVLDAAYNYGDGFVETFDGMGQSNSVPGEGTNTYWSVVSDEKECATQLVVADTSTEGERASGFNACGAQSDRHLSLGKTKEKRETNYLVARFRNGTGHPRKEIKLYYDMECSWTQYDRKKLCGAAFVVSYSTNRTHWTTMPNFGATIDNSRVTKGKTWFSDAEMDAQGLAVRRAGGTFALPQALPPGADLYIRWDAVKPKKTGKKSKEYKGVCLGIDNIAGRPFAPDDDSDGDGLTDNDEVTIGADRFNPDSDGDGASDSSEWLAGTDVMNPHSYWQIRARRSASGNELNWDTLTGRRYTLYTCADLANPVWSAVPGCMDKPGIDDTMFVTHRPTSSVAYYRVELTPTN